MRIFSSLPLWFTINALVLAVVVAINVRDPSFTTEEWWRDVEPVATALLSGGLVSFLFYFLVVHLPEQRKRSVIKLNLQSVYSQIKKDIAYQIIYASQKGGRTDLHANEDTVASLMTVKGFNQAFEGGSESDEGFYAFRNHISEDVPEYREIVLSLRMLAKQVNFVLHNYPIRDPKIFSFFSGLELFLMRLEAIGPGYNEEKELSRFVMEIFGGWHWSTGDRGHDIIKKMIDDI